MRILLVEDEPNAAKLLAEGLREEAYAVDVASDGETALEQAFLNDYDLIILDVMLPRKDGVQEGPKRWVIPAQGCALATLGQ